MRNRAIRATELNNESSRSHTILQLYIQLHGQDSSGFATLTRSTLSFVDLAGSEKWRPSLTSVSTQSSDQQIREMTNINTSLHVLGNCVSALIESGRKHIPFRDSILTRLLQDSLGGGKTTLIATVRSDELMRDETYSTLQFASRASKIKTILRPLSRQFANQLSNSNSSLGDVMTLEQARKEIAMLRARVQSLESQLLQQSLHRPPPSEMRRIFIPFFKPHESRLDGKGEEIEISDSCQGCSALESALLRYLSTVRSLPTSLSDTEETAAWGYSSTEEDLCHRGDGASEGEAVEEEREEEESAGEEESEKNLKRNLTKDIVKKSRSKRQLAAHRSSATASLVYGNGNLKKKKVKIKKAAQKSEAVGQDEATILQLQGASPPSPIAPAPMHQESRSDGSLKSKNSPRYLQEGCEDLLLQPSSMISPVVPSPVVTSGASHLSGTLGDQSQPLVVKNWNSIVQPSSYPSISNQSFSDTYGGKSEPSSLVERGSSHFKCATHTLAAESSISTLSSYRQSSQPIPTSAVHQPPPSADGTCQKHGLQACVLCSMFSSSTISTLTPIPSAPLNTSALTLSSLQTTKPTPLSLPFDQSSSTSMLLQRPSFPPSNHFASACPSGILCPIHFVTNCLLCSLSKSSSKISSSPAQSSSSLHYAPAMGSSSSLASLPPQSLSSSSSHPFSYSRSPGHDPSQSLPNHSLSRPVHSEESVILGWERMAPLHSSSSPVALQPLSLSHQPPIHSPSLPTLHQHHPPSVRQSSAIMNSLSSADSSFGFIPTAQSSSPAQSFHQSSSPPAATAGIRPPSHHHPRQRTPSNRSIISSSMEASPTSSTPTPTSISIPLAGPEIQPYQHLKKGIVFEDQNDDIGSAGTDRSRRLVDHRRASSHGFQDQGSSNQQEEDEGRFARIRSSQIRQGKEHEGGKGSPSARKKESNKKLKKLPNGALVKRR